jgi:hypothetical protein
VLRRHPQLTVVIAHCGMPEYAEHIALAERYPNVHLDTMMVGTPFTETFMPFDQGCCRGLPSCATGSCSDPTFRTFPIDTPSNWQPSNDSTSATTGYGQSAGTTVSGCSANTQRQIASRVADYRRTVRRLVADDDLGAQFSARACSRASSASRRSRATRAPKPRTASAGASSASRCSSAVATTLSWYSPRTSCNAVA